MDNVTTYPWDSKDTKQALLRARIAEREAERGKARETVVECTVAIDSLTEQLKELGEA